MNHPAYAHRQTVTDDFLTFGNEGIAINRAAERRDREGADHRLAATLDMPGPLRSVRRLIGQRLIAAGTTLAGAVPVPAPDASEPGSAVTG